MKTYVPNYVKLPHIGHRWRFLNKDANLKFEKSKSVYYTS